MDKNSIGVILIYVAFMAILILPTYFANKKQKAELLESLKVGDKITTVGGIQGTIVNILTETVEMKIDKNARMTVLKSAVDKIEKK